MNNALDYLNGHSEMQSLMPTRTLPPPLPQTPTSRTKRLSLTLPLHHHHRTHNTINIPCNIVAIYDHLKQRKQQGHTRINTRKEEQSIQDLKPKEARAANKNKNKSTFSDGTPGPGCSTMEWLQRRWSGLWWRDTGPMLFHLGGFSASGRRGNTGTRLCHYGVAPARVVRTWCVCWMEWCRLTT